MEAAHFALSGGIVPAQDTSPYIYKDQLDPDNSQLLH